MGLLLVAGSGCFDHADAPQVAGKETYAQHCSSCHQPDGRGYDDIYPALRRNRIVLLSSPQPIIDIVLRGRGSMPPFSDELTPDELANVITYVRSSWGNHAGAVSARELG